MKINHNSDAINIIYMKVFGDSEAEKKTPPKSSAPVTDDDKALIEKAMNAKGGDKCKQLW